jgi:hypothetical protein
MHKNSGGINNRKDDPCDTPVETDSHFPQSLLELTDDGHTHRPTELHCPDLATNRLSVERWQRL